MRLTTTVKSYRLVQIFFHLLETDMVPFYNQLEKLLKNSHPSNQTKIVCKWKISLTCNDKSIINKPNLCFYFSRDDDLAKEKASLDKIAEENEIVDETYGVSVKQFAKCV